MPYSVQVQRARKRRRRALLGFGIAATLLTAAAFQLLVVVHPDQMALRVRSVLHALGPAGLSARSVSWSWPDRIELAGIDGRIPGAGKIQAGKAVVRHRFRDLFAESAAPRAFRIEGTALLALESWDAGQLFEGLDRLGTLEEVQVERLIVGLASDEGAPSLVLRELSAWKNAEGWYGRAKLEGPGFSDGTLGFRSSGRSHTIQLSNLELAAAPPAIIPLGFAEESRGLGLRGTAGLILEGGGSIGWKAVLQFHDASARPAACPIDIEGLSGNATIDATGFHARALSGRTLGGAFKLIGPGLRLDANPELQLRQDRALVSPALGAALPGDWRGAWGAIAPSGELGELELRLNTSASTRDSSFLRGTAIEVRSGALPEARYRGGILLEPSRLRLERGLIEAGPWRLEDLNASFGWDGGRWRSEDFRALSSGAQVNGILELRAPAVGGAPALSGRLAAVSMPLAAFLRDQEAVGLMAAELELDSGAWRLTLRFSGADPGDSSPLAAVYGHLFPGLRRWADAGMIRMSGNTSSSSIDRILLKLPGTCVSGRSPAPFPSGEGGDLVLFHGPRSGLLEAYASGTLPPAFERATLHGTMRSLQVRERSPASLDDPAARAAFLDDEARAFFEK